MNISTQDEIYIDLTEENIFIQTYGGEYKDDDVEFAEYGIGLGDLHIKLNPDQAVELYNKLGEHLRNNGRIK